MNVIRILHQMLHCWQFTQILLVIIQNVALMQCENLLRILIENSVNIFGRISDV